MAKRKISNTNNAKLLAKVKAQDIEAAQALAEMNQKNPDSLIGILNVIINETAKLKEQLFDDGKSVVLEDLLKKLDNKIEHLEDNSTFWNIIKNTLFGKKKTFKSRIKALPSKLSQLFLEKLGSYIEGIAIIGSRSTTLQKLEEIKEQLKTFLKELDGKNHPLEKILKKMLERVLEKITKIEKVLEKKKNNLQVQSKDTRDKNQNHHVEQQSPDHQKNDGQNKVDAEKQVLEGNPTSKEDKKLDNKLSPEIEKDKPSVTSNQKSDEIQQRTVVQDGKEKTGEISKVSPVTVTLLSKEKADIPIKVSNATVELDKPIANAKGNFKNPSSLDQSARQEANNSQTIDNKVRQNSVDNKFPQEEIVKNGEKGPNDPLIQDSGNRGELKNTKGSIEPNNTQDNISQKNEQNKGLNNNNENSLESSHKHHHKHHHHHNHHQPNLTEPRQVGDNPTTIPKDTGNSKVAESVDKNATNSPAENKPQPELAKDAEKNIDQSKLDKEALKAARRKERDKDTFSDSLKTEKIKTAYSEAGKERNKIEDQLNKYKPGMKIENNPLSADKVKVKSKNIRS